MLTLTASQAQLQIVPIEPFRQTVTRPSATPTRPSALKLPFFDDFSTIQVHSRPDPALWQNSNQVYINNTLPINHPSVNVATLDGLRENGSPYNLSSPNAYGPTDTLTSQAIHLGTNKTTDSLFLSFYWQRQGLGELPDEEDSLRLQFLNASGTWKTVWLEKGATSTTTFTQTFIPVDSPEYLHASFQFRFQAFGRQTGLFDLWHLDYIYLNQSRSTTDRYIKDVTTRQALTPYLKRYFAMPLRQYLVDPISETANTIQTDIVNLFNNFNFTTFTFTVREQISGQQIQQFQQNTPENIGSLSSQIKVAYPLPLPTTFSGKRAIVQSKFHFLTTDDQNPSIPSVNLRRNDTISATTILDDYYAYDDGTAEAGLQLTQRQGRVAMRFIVNKRDTISGIRISLVPVKTDLTGKIFVLNLFESDRGLPGRVVYQKALTVKYPETRNGFVDFPFDNGIVVRDTFYVGWTQVTEDNLLAVGYDKNSPFGQQVWVNLGSIWESANLTGVPMLRPVIGRANTGSITGVEPEPEPWMTILQVFPNPNPGTLLWDNPSIRQIDVLDLNGRLRISTQPLEGQNRLDVDALPVGLYLVRLWDGKRSVVQKILIKR